MPSPPRICPHCRQRVRKLNPHKMDASKIAVLRHAAWLHTATSTAWVQCQLDFQMVVDDGRTFGTVKDSRVHAQRLKYFGLMESKGRRTGAYRVTEEGYLFLRGGLAVPETIWCRDGRVVKSSPTTFTIGKVADVVFDKAHWDSYGAMTRYEDEV